MEQIWNSYETHTLYETNRKIYNGQKTHSLDSTNSTQVSPSCAPITGSQRFSGATSYYKSFYRPLQVQNRLTPK